MLPTLDVASYLRDPGGPAGTEFVEALRDALHDIGFCYIRGHGISRDLDDRLMSAARAFFALPREEREALAIANSPHFRGYTLLGDERTLGISDWREQIDIGPEEPAPALSPDDPPWQRLRGPNQWPASLPRMSGDVAAWMRAIEPLGLMLMRAIARGLGQPPHVFDDAMTPNPYTRMKIVRYPAQEAATDTGQGLGLHHDSGILTLILQDSQPGLQVERGGRLYEVPHKPGAYVLNLGEMLQSVSSGYLRATRHCVVSPPPGRERLSIAYFMNPRLDATFEPIELPPELAAHAPGGQNADPSDPIYTVFGENTLKIRMRAHPDVTAAHYADIVSD